MEVNSTKASMEAFMDEIQAFADVLEACTEVPSPEAFMEAFIGSYESFHWK